MATHIVRLAPSRGPTPARPSALRQPATVPARVHFWTGASGQRYVHNVHSLIECPPLPRAVYLLVRRELDGASTVLHIAASLSDAPTLNLARIRHRGATLGANEVHVHLLATSAEQCRTIACDLRAGLFGSLGAEPTNAGSGSAD